MTEKFPYIVILRGCDDETEINIEVTSEEIELLKRIAELSEKASEFQCMPTMIVGFEHEFEDNEYLD